MAQMFVASASMVLLIDTGVTTVSIGAAVAATALTWASRWLFRRAP